MTGNTSKLTLHLTGGKNPFEDGFVPFSDGFLTGDPQIVLPTIALAFSRPYRNKVNDYTLGTVLSALYAAGANVLLSRSDLSVLADEPKHFAHVFDRPPLNGLATGRIIGHALEAAKHRGENRHGSAELIDLRIKFGDIIAAGGLAGEERSVLLTHAFVNQAVRVNNTDDAKLALSMLAIYAAGTALTFTKEDFEKLVAAAEQNDYVLERAIRRATEDGIR